MKTPETLATLFSSTSMNHRPCALHAPSLVVLAMMALMARNCPADVVYSNFGPNDSYHAGTILVNNYVSGGYSIYKNINGTCEVAVGFVPTKDVYLDSIKLAVENQYANGPADLDVWVMSNDSNRTILESFHFAGSVPFDDGNWHTPLAANSTLHPLLKAGQTYWLAASQANNTPNAYSYAAWKFNSIGAVGLSGGRVVDANGVDSGWGGGWDTNPGPGAFEIQGTPVTPVTAVPLPAVCWPGFLTLASLAILRRTLR